MDSRVFVIVLVSGIQSTHGRESAQHTLCVKYGNSTIRLDPYGQLTLLHAGGYSSWSTRLLCYLHISHSKST